MAINTAAIGRPEFLTEASETFGSSTIVLAIDAIRTPQGHYEAYTDYGRERTGVDAIEWAEKGVELGAGEILVTSIDREGTGEGFDLALSRAISESVSVPVIASGGAGGPEDVLDVLVDGRADAVAVASILHYGQVRDLTSDRGEVPGEGNVLFLEDSDWPPPVDSSTVGAIKHLLLDRGLECRV